MTDLDSKQGHDVVAAELRRMAKRMRAQADREYYAFDESTNASRHGGFYDCAAMLERRAGRLSTTRKR